MGELSKSCILALGLAVGKPVKK